MGRAKAKTKATAGVRWPAGLAETPARCRWFERISRLPPGLTVAEAARRLRATPAAARKWLLVFGYPYTPGAGRRPPTAWDRVDWSLSDAEIGRRMGVHRQTALNHRRARGLPPSERKGRRRPGPLRAWVAAHAGELAGRPARAVAAAYARATGRRVTAAAALGAMREAGVPRGRRGGRPARLADPNWALPSGVLAAAWGVKFETVRLYRYLRRAGPPRWDAAAAPRDPAYRAAVKAEREKARRLRYDAGR